MRLSQTGNAMPSRLVEAICLILVYIETNIKACYQTKEIQEIYMAFGVENLCLVPGTEAVGICICRAKLIIHLLNKGMMKISDMYDSGAKMRFRAMHSIFL
jgi:hypothetical protein